MIELNTFSLVQMDKIKSTALKNTFGTSFANVMVENSINAYQMNKFVEYANTIRKKLELAEKLCKKERFTEV